MADHTDPNCIFCRIAAGTIAAPLLHSDDDCVAFADQNPQAPTHILVIPREHIASVAVAAATQQALLGKLLLTAQALAGKANLAEGFRLVINTGPDGGQTVHHLHVHVLGGRTLHWPPG